MNRAGIRRRLRNHLRYIAYGSCITLETYRLAPEDLIARNRRAYISLYVRGNQIVACKVVNEWPAFRIVHRVGQVADQDNIHLLLHQLS